MLPILRICCCSTRDLYLGLAPPCGIAIRETTFPMSMSKPAHSTKNLPGNIIGTIMTSRTVGTAIFIATQTKRTTAFAVMTMPTMMAIGIS